MAAEDKAAAARAAFNADAERNAKLAESEARKAAARQADREAVQEQRAESSAPPK